MPGEVLAAFSRIRRGTDRSVLGLSVTTQVPDLGLQAKKFNPQPFHLMASDHPVELNRFLDLLFVVKARLFKGWLVCFNGEVIEHEVTLSNFGVSLDGKLHEVSGIERGIEYIKGKLPRAFFSQQYYFGKNAQASILGLPQVDELGEEPFIVSPSSQRTEEFGEVSFSLDGATSLDSMERVVNPLVRSKHLLRLTIDQPALSVAVEQLVIYKDQRNGTFSYDCYFRPTTEGIISNLRKSLLIKKE